MDFSRLIGRALIAAFLLGAAFPLAAAADGGAVIIYREVPTRPAYRDGFPGPATSVNPGAFTQDAVHQGGGGVMGRELADGDFAAVTSQAPMRALGVTGAAGDGNGAAQQGALAATRSATGTSATTMNAVMGSTMAAAAAAGNAGGAAGAAVQGLAMQIGDAVRGISITGR